MIKADSIRYWCDADSGLELILCDNSKLSYPLHNHISVFTIGIVLDGSMILNTNHTIHIYTLPGTPIMHALRADALCAFKYNKNQTFVIPPYVPHSIKANDKYSLLSICIRKDLINCSSYGIDKMMFDITNLLDGVLGSNKINAELLPKLLSCVHSFNDIFSVSAMGISDPCIERLKRQLELFPEDKFSVEEMAHEAFMSKYCFIRRFKQAVGLTPHQFQIQNRIRKAQRLMSKADTITKVALTTGFCDQSHFIKQFEKHVGLTPSTYKLSTGIFKPYTAG